jgi:hypothetical protein
VYRLLLLTILVPLLIQPLLLTASELSNSTNNPMQPPAFALQQYQQEKNENKPKVGVVQKKRVKSKPLLLASILYSSTRKIVIINEKMLSVSDTIDGAKLVSIKNNSVRLVRNGKTINLRLLNQSKHIHKTAVQKTMDKKK